jgi:hypothetical protein
MDIAVSCRDAARRSEVIMISSITACAAKGSWAQISASIVLRQTFPDFCAGIVGYLPIMKAKDAAPAGRHYRKISINPSPKRAEFIPDSCDLVASASRHKSDAAALTLSTPKWQC